MISTHGNEIGVENLHPNQYISIEDYIAELSLPSPGSETEKALGVQDWNWTFTFLARNVQISPNDHRAQNRHMGRGYV